MRISFDWLKDYIKLDDNAADVAARLTMLGHEVEGIEEVDDDLVMEVNVTPNRPDCLSIFGLARELSASYGIPAVFPEHNFTAEPDDLNFNIDILDPDLCNRYAGRILKDINVSQSPEWMKKRLEKCGIRAINNIVDVTNYVLLELGHPLHAFDLRTLKGSTIRVRTPKTVEGIEGALKFKTLDGIERLISNDALLIWDGVEPVAIAGIMGGMDSEVKDDTKDIFIEGAYFYPASIRRTSKLLGLKTESSYRFERGSDIKMLKKALDRAAFLMKKIGGGRILGKLDIYPKIYHPAEININCERINSVLGINLACDEIIDYLERLGFDVSDSPEGIKVKPTSYRRDINREADIVEEIARLYGYDRIPSELPKASIASNEPNGSIISKKNTIKDSFRMTFLKNGYTEAINFSFMGEQEIELLMIADGDERKKVIKIMNPLRIEDSYMRTTLIPSLLKNLQHNLSHGNRDLRLFEISRIFIDDKSFNKNIDPLDMKLPDERLHAAVVCYREKTKTLYRDDTHDFYLVKGILESELKSLKLDNYSFVRSSEPFLHPGQSADIYLSDTKIGYIGMLTPTVINKLDIKAYRPQIVVAELDLETLSLFFAYDIVYSPFSKFPYVERDTAVILDTQVESSSIIRLVREYPTELLDDAFIFDVYQGNSIPLGKKSIAFNIRYRAADRTLTDEEVDVLHNALVEFILQKTDGQLRA